MIAVIADIAEIGSALSWSADDHGAFTAAHLQRFSQLARIICL
jgi:hypothetical protein